MTNEMTVDQFLPYIKGQIDQLLDFTSGEPQAGCAHAEDIDCQLRELSSLLHKLQPAGRRVIAKVFTQEVLDLIFCFSIVAAEQVLASTALSPRFSAFSDSSRQSSLTSLLIGKE